MDMSELEKKRDSIQKEMLTIGEMLNGTLSLRYRKCGSTSCSCFAKGHPGHGPHYSLSYHDATGKLLVRNLSTLPEKLTVEKQINNYHRYKELHKQFVAVHTAICLLRNSQTGAEHDTEKVKKNSKKKY